MAGDWIKMRIDLQTHPKIVRIMSATCPNKFQVIGGLHAIWSIFDVHSENGELEGYTLDMMDAVIGWPGFSDAVAAVGWLEETPESLVMPEFEAHNGQSAKRRAEDSKKKKQRRLSANCPKNDGQNADEKRTREEKRREDNKTPIVPFQKVVDLYHETLPELPAVQLLTEKRKAAIRARWGTSENTQSLDWWRDYFLTCKETPFLMGKNDRNWRADFDFLMTESKFAKIVEGGYQGGAQ